MMMAHLLLWGNAYAEIEVSDGRPVGLWPIHPSRVDIRRNQAGGLEYVVRLSGLRPAGRLGETAVLPARLMLHIRGLGTDGLKGMSPIAAQRTAISLGLSGQELAWRFFEAGAAPSAVLQHPGQLSAAAQERLRAYFENNHGGLSRMQRVAILEEGMTLHPWTMPLEDAQFLQQRQFTVSEIARIYRMQPHKIQDLTHATFSNVEHQSIEHVVDTVRPWLVRWEQRLSASLLLPEERGNIIIEHLVEGLLRGDTVSRYQAYAVGRQWGWLSANDIRERENMNPIAGGDQYLTPMNMIPVSGGSASANGAGLREGVL